MGITPAELRRALETAAQIADRDQGDNDLESALNALKALTESIDEGDVISACEIMQFKGDFLFLHGRHGEALECLRVALRKARTIQHLELTITINRHLSQVEHAMERTSHIPAQALR